MKTLLISLVVVSGLVVAGSAYAAVGPTCTASVNPTVSPLGIVRNITVTWSSTGGPLRSDVFGVVPASGSRTYLFGGKSRRFNFVGVNNPFLSCVTVISTSSKVAPD